MARKSMRPGGGGRFKKLSSSLQKKGYSKARANAVAASIGRKKYGAKKMARFSAQGRRRAATNRKK